MAEIERLHRRMQQLESELAAVMAETEVLQRAHARKKRGRRLTGVAALLAIGVCWSLATVAAGTGTTMTAPFQVLDANNKPIFEVLSSPRTFVVYNSNGGYALSGTALDKDAFFKVAPPDASVNVVLAVQGSSPQLRLRSGGAERDRLLFEVAPGGTPIMIMYGSNKGQDIMQFREGPRGEGLLELNNSSGDLKVLADVTDEGYGKVEALPLGNPLGSAIVGRRKAQ
jgi:hypothetical protein